MSIYRNITAALAGFLNAAASGLRVWAEYQVHEAALEATLARQIGTPSQPAKYRQEYAYQAAMHCALQGITLPQLRKINSAAPQTPPQKRTQSPSANERSL